FLSYDLHITYIYTISLHDALPILEYSKFRSAEKDDYILYKFNTQKFRSYAIMALCVILLMLMFIIYYQYVVSKYEKKLIKEKERSEEHTSELQSRENLVCRLLLEK